VTYPLELALKASNNATWSAGPIALHDEAGAPLAMPEGVAVRMQLRAPATSDTVALELSIANGRLQWADRDAATVSIEVPALAMRAIAAGAYDTDIIVEYPSGRVVRPAAGTVTILQGVTR
jgi:hypothetical protein